MPSSLHDSSEVLETRLASILTSHMLTEDPEPVLRDLRVAAGDNTALLARLCGQVAGFFMSAKTAVMCSAIVEHIDGAAEWAEIGRQRRLLAVDHDGEFESSPEANF